MKNIVDGVFSAGKLYILSSPQDVLTWCSSFISVLGKNSDGSFSFISNISLSGNVATYMSSVSDGIIAIPIQDKTSLNLIYGENLADIKLNVSDFSYLSSYMGAFFFSSALDRKIFFARDIREFINTKKTEVFNEVERFKGSVFSDGKLGIALPYPSFIYILPDSITYVIRNENIKELMDISDFKEPFLFIPVKSKDNGYGILAIYSSCLRGSEKADESESVKICEWFMSITGVEFNSIRRFRTFSFDFEEKKFFIFSISGNIVYDKVNVGGLMSIWLWDGKSSFQHISSSGLLPSPFYEVVDFSVEKKQNGSKENKTDGQQIDKQKEEEDNNKIDWGEEEIYMRVIKRWRASEDKLSYFEFRGGKWSDEEELKF